MKYKEFEIVPAFGHDEDIRLLFAEYTQMLVDNDPVFASYLELQSFDDEIAHLEHKYGELSGRLYIAYINGIAAGCIGLKKNDELSCELKRMYVKPLFRGEGLAEFMGKLIIGDARSIGYKYILLDTLPFLQSAQRLYKRLGFYEIEKYNDSPMDNATYMRYDL